MSYKIKTLTVKNFVVFVDETTVDFSMSGLNQIEAAFKNDSQQSNGAGKSILICAISLALFGKGIRFTHLSDYIAPSNPDGGIYIGLELEDDAGNLLKIERWRRPGSETNKTKVWMNGSAVSKDATNQKTDDIIAGYIGVSHSNFLSCIFSVMLPGFLNQRPAQRFEILENALAVRKMDSIIKKLNNSQKIADEKLSSTNQVLTEKHQLFGQEQARKEIFAQNRDTLLSSIKRQEAEITLLYHEEEALQKKRNILIDTLDALELKLAERRQQYSTVKSIEMSLTTAKDKVLQSIRGLDKSFKSVGDAEIECLVCHSTLDKTSEVSIRSHFQSELTDLNAKLVKVADTINLYNDAITKLEASLNTAKKGVAKLDGDLKINSSSAIACEKTIENSRESLRLAESAFDPTQLDLLITDLANLGKQKTDLQKDVKIITAWKQAMSKNGLRLAYLREEVGTLSAIASKFASSVYNKPTKVEFFINDEKDNPQLDFTVNAKSAAQFSTGERRLLEIAITLSLMTLLKTAGMNLEFLILDEALDGLSITSKVNVLRIISDLSKDYQILMISHDDMIKRHPGHIIKVIKDPTTNTSTVEMSVR